MTSVMFFTFLSSLFTLAAIMITGYFCRRNRLLNDYLNAGLSSLLVKITVPCTIFMSLMRPFTRTLLTESLIALLLSTAVFLFGGALGYILAKLLHAAPDEKRIWQFALIFGNVGYMGFPITQAVFGDDGMIYASMANASFNLLAFTVGIRLFNPREKDAETAKQPFSWFAIVKNPALAATILGFVLFVTGLRIPTPLENGIGMLSAMTTPLSMLLVGSILAKSSLLDLFTDMRILPVIFTRLLVIPLTVFFVLRWCIHNPLMLGVLVTLSAMPAASLTAIFAEQYESNTALASRLVALSTGLCILTMPVISLLL